MSAVYLRSARPASSDSSSCSSRFSWPSWLEAPREADGGTQQPRALEPVQPDTRYEIDVIGQVHARFETGKRPDTVRDSFCERREHDGRDDARGQNVEARLALVRVAIKAHSTEIHQRDLRRQRLVEPDGRRKRAVALRGPQPVRQWRWKQLRRGQIARGSRNRRQDLGAARQRNGAAEFRFNFSRPRERELDAPVASKRRPYAQPKSNALAT